MNNSISKIISRVIAVALLGISAHCACAQEGVALVWSTNVVGLLPVQSTNTYTALACPFTQVAWTGGWPTAFADLVKTKQLTVGGTPETSDQLVAYDHAKKVYTYYWLKDVNGTNRWEEMTTYKVTYTNLLGNSESVIAPAPDEKTLTRGYTFWLKRLNGGTPHDIYMHGQHNETKQITEIKAGVNGKAGYNFIGNGRLTSLDLNSLDWTNKAYASSPGSSDEIVIVDENGIYKNYYFLTGSGTSWDGKWIQLVRSGSNTTFGNVSPIPPGVGFWYVRRGSGDFSISIKE